jgi:hypothetical protein
VREREREKERERDELQWPLFKNNGVGETNIHVCKTDIYFEKINIA